MNLQHLRYVLEVDRYGSISKAAESLFMNQPNLSKALKELEQELGIRLFHRTSKGVKVTAEGEEFLRFAQNILSQVEDLETHFQNQSMQRCGFRISIPRVSYIAHAFTRFVSQLDPETQMQICYQETNSEGAIQNILEEGYPMGILRMNQNQSAFYEHYLMEKRLAFQPIFTFEYLVLLSQCHPLIQKERLGYDDLLPYIEILHGDLSVPRSKEKKELLPSQKQIFLIERGGQFDLLSSIHTTYMWVSPMPENVLQREGLVQRKCPVENHTYTDILIYPEGHSFSEPEQCFLDILSRVRDEVTIFAEQSQ